MILNQIDIIRVKDNNTILQKDCIIDEDILKIYINKHKSFEMVATITHLHSKALVAGFLFTQGIICKKTDIENIVVYQATKKCHVQLTNDALKKFNRFQSRQQIKGSSGGTLLQNKTIHSAAGSNCLQNNNLISKIHITANQVISLIKMHSKHSMLFQQTGAIHSAGLCTPSKILSFYEDIGRHNALDKLAGDIFLNSIDTHDKIATLSCRMSLEIIGKIVKTGIPIVISNAAPTLPAVELANKAGITMIGFVRNNRFNIYTHDQRVLHAV